MGRYAGPEKTAGGLGEGRGDGSGERRGDSGADAEEEPVRRRRGRVGNLSVPSAGASLGSLQCCLRAEAATGRRTGTADDRAPPDRAPGTGGAPDRAREEHG